MRIENNNTPHEEVDNNKNDKYAYLNNLDTVKLQSMLQQESFLSEDNNFNIDLIKRITAILDERDPITEEPDPKAYLKAFKEEFVPELEKEQELNSTSRAIQPAVSTKPRKFRRRVATILLAAIVSILLGSSLVASAFGYKLWEYVFNWGKETFQIGAGAQVTAGPAVSSSPQLDAKSVKPNKYKSIEEAKKVLNVYVLVPSWIPRGFEFSSANISDNNQLKSLTAVYKYEDKNIFFSAAIYSTKDADYFNEIDEGSGESTMISGRQCHIMTNIDRVSVVWIDDRTVYNIDGDISKDDLIKMVNSIYKGDT